MATQDTKRVEDMNYFEMLAWLGIGSSHPGGFPATLQNLQSIQILPEDYVLDAGCGSGLTACHIAKTTGCKIMGIDISPEMIEKATQRAASEGVSHLIEFKVGDVQQLPFADQTFDWVIAESVTVFLDKVKVYREFHRVLKPEGYIADHEMALLKELPVQLKQQLEECYGSGTNPLTYEGWCQTLTQAGFQDVEIKNPQPLKSNSNSNLIVNALKKDWVLIKGLADKARRQPGLLPRLQKNAGFMKQYQSYFGFGLVYGRKPTPTFLPKSKRVKDWILRLLRFQ